jgi:hypothetical protein
MREHSSSVHERLEAAADGGGDPCIGIVGAQAHVGCRGEGEGVRTSTDFSADLLKGLAHRCVL